MKNTKDTQKPKYITDTTARERYNHGHFRPQHSPCYDKTNTHDLEMMGKHLKIARLQKPDRLRMLRQRTERELVAPMSFPGSVSRTDSGRTGYSLNGRIYQVTV